MPLAFFHAISLSGVFFVTVGVAMLRNKNWGRLAYLIVAPLLLGINLVSGTFRLGIENLYDRIPSIIVTGTFMTLLLSSPARTWFAETGPEEHAEP